MMRKPLIIILFLSLILSGCVAGVGGLKSYINASSGYEFLYPNGWVPVEGKKATEGVDVVFRDIIDSAEHLSLVISNINDNENLTNVGTAMDVGSLFMKRINNDSKMNVQAELINAESHQSYNNTYYVLEYQVKLPSGEERHHVASIVVNRNKLFTFNLASSEKRWSKVKDLYKVAVNSFSVT